MCVKQANWRHLLICDILSLDNLEQVPHNHLYRSKPKVPQVKLALHGSPYM